MLSLERNLILGKISTHIPPILNFRIMFWVRFKTMVRVRFRVKDRVRVQFSLSVPCGGAGRNISLVYLQNK